MPGHDLDDEYESYRGTDARLLNGFLRRHLVGAQVYRRAIGFFSSSVFGVAIDEFAEFFRRGGRFEVVCSPIFSAQDVATLRFALYGDMRHSQRFDRVLRSEKNEPARATLAWAIGSGSLDLRIAIVQSVDRKAIYHEKIGVLSFADGSRVAFEGSANESSPGYVTNFERIVVYKGTTGRRDNVRVQAIEQDFERLWSNATPGVTVISLHDAFKNRLLQVRTETIHGISFKQSGSPILEMSVPAEILKLPPRLKLRNYQDEAIRRWLANGGCGIYAMATGAGKTITALATVEQLYKRVGPPLAIIIVAPYLNLVDQWMEEAKKFGLDPINCSGASRDWTSVVDMAMYLNQSRERPILSLVTTNATFAGAPFQRVLSKLRVRTVLIADEVHNLGARHLRRRLPDRIQLRLGLSATPERWMDEEGTATVTDYFGKVVYSYNLEEALRGDTPTLSPYVYRPILVELEEDEREEYLHLTSLLARYMNDPQGENLSDIALSLLLKRARLVACARGKLAALREVIVPFRYDRYNLVYCGDGRVEVASASSLAVQDVSETPVLRQVHAVTRLLGLELGMNVTTYTAETTREARRELLREFAEGDKQALVAIRCLDEGVDIPQVRRAFILASSTNPRQFIQRRGRVLRRAEGKDGAEVYAVL